MFRQIYGCATGTLMQGCGRIGGNHGRIHESALRVTGYSVLNQGTPIRLYVADLDVRIVTLDGTLLRHLTLDTSRTYQPSGLSRTRVREGSCVPR